MATTIQEMMAQRAELDRKIADAQRNERADAIAKIKALMTDYNLTPADLTVRPVKVSRAESGGTRKAGGKVAPKYRNAATGETWTGRGLQPKWLKAAIQAGAKLSDFAL